VTGAPPIRREPVPVTLLTQSDCRMCEQAKAVLARTGAEGLTIVHEVDLSSEVGKALAVQHGVLFAPGIIVGGRPFSYGRLSEKKLRRHLQRSVTRPAPTESREE